MEGTYIRNLNEYKSIRIHWIVLYTNDENLTCFDSFGVKHISKEIKKFLGNKNITVNITVNLTVF